MSSLFGRMLLPLGAAVVVAALPSGTLCQDLFARKTITLVVGYAPGGSYDLYARLAARHLGKHLPGQPAVVPQNMPGAGSLQAANWLWGVAPKDGTAIAVLAETLPMEQALANPGAKYDAAKFTYVGRIASSNNVHIVWHTAKAQSVEDAKTIEMTVAGTGPANLAETVPTLLNAIAGTKFKIVSGYPSSGPAMLAMERGEIDGTGTSWAALKSQKQDWIRDKKIKIILQDLPTRDPELPDVPALVEFAKTDGDRQILTLYASGGAMGRYVTAPPELTAEVAGTLRKGFMAMVKDPEFLAEAKKVSLDVEPATAEDLLATAQKTLKVTDAVRARVRQIFQVK